MGLRQIEEAPDRYPDAQMFGDLPAYGFYCRHVQGLSFENVTVTSTHEDGRPALVFDDVLELRLASFLTSPLRSDAWRNAEALVQFRPASSRLDIAAGEAAGGLCRLSNLPR
jgi:hypothetical protein